MKLLFSSDWNLMLHVLILVSCQCKMEKKKGFKDLLSNVYQLQTHIVNILITSEQLNIFIQYWAKA